MLGRFDLDKMRDQTFDVMRLGKSGFGKRIAAFVTIFAALVWLGYAPQATLLAGLFALSEGLGFALHQNLTRDRSRTKAVTILLYWLLHSSSVVIYLIPGYLLGHEGSTGLLLASVLWTLGVMVHVIGVFAAYPAYNWGLLVPIFSFGLEMLWHAAELDYRPATPLEWALCLVFFVLYGVNSFETLRQQSKTHRALSAAREEANHRLRALEHLSDHDPLTGLHNRRSFDARLARLLASKKDGRQVAIFMVDLDGFKPINDTYSHSAGDEVLQAIARRLCDLVGAPAVVARFGGDEFAIALPGMGSDRAAFRLGRYIQRAIEQPIAVGTKMLQVGASVGISLSRDDAATVASLCSTADQAMFRAKSSHGRKVELYQASAYPPRLTLEDREDLLAAFQAREIRPYYQPKVDLDTGLTFGFEALARWVHPQRGVLLPADFIPQINHLGLQADFLLHMTRQVLQDLTGLVAEGLSPGEVSVNVPEVTLATLSGRAELDRLLTAFPEAAPYLTLEITEDVFIARSAGLIRESIDHFRRKGLRVALDDFGTGFASLQHLAQLRFDELKIDASFISDICSNRTNEVLVGGFLQIAKGLGVQVIAEGLESEAQMRKIRSLGCARAQGFLFGQAMPLSESRIRLYTQQNARTADLGLMSG